MKLKYIALSAISAVLVTSAIYLTNISETDSIKNSSAGFYWPGESLPCPETRCEPIYPEEGDLSTDYDKQKEDNEQSVVQQTKPVETEKPKAEQNTPTSQIAQVTPDNIKEVTSAQVSSGYETYAQYEVTILGTCPSQRSYNIWEKHSRLNSLGIITSGPNKTTPISSMESDIEALWEMYMESGPVLGDKVSRANGFYFIWSTRTVTNDKQPARAEELTNYLRSLESRYKAKCPND